MINLHIENIQSLLFCGDIHGEFETIVNKLNNYGNTEYKHIYLIPDYTIVSINVTNILCIGGATSIDRSYRIRQEQQVGKKTYWGDGELPCFDEDKLNEINRKYKDKIHIVATHTCPSFAYPTTRQGILEWLRVDTGLSDVIDRERLVMDKIFASLQPKQNNIKDWYYGH